MDSMNQWLALLACGTAAALVAAWLSRRHYAPQVRDLAARIDRADKARAHANELLLQARRQIEGLQKDLVASRRSRHSTAASRPAPPPAVPAAAPSAGPSRALRQDDDQQDTRIMPPPGFAETMPFEP